MSRNPADPLDPEDMFADTRMSFGDHIEDLRVHLLRALKGFLIGMVLSIYPLGTYVLGIITAPVEEQLSQFERRKLRRDFKDTRKRIEDGGLTLPSIRVQLILEDSGSGKAMPQELDKMVAFFEEMLVDLDAHHLLDKELRQRGNFKVVQAHIDNPLQFSQQVMEITAKARRHSLATMHITEAFFVYFKVALLTGLVLSSPWVFYHIWMFVAAGLYPNEKRLVNIYLPFSLFLFISGVVLCQWAVMPRAVGALLWFNEWLGLDADLRLNEWLGFALMMPVVFGVSFQTPLVMMFVHRVGISSVQGFRDKRRIVWFIMAIFAALITPTPDPMSMMFLWVPMIGLYELGILLCIYQGEQPSLFDWEEEEKSSELVEV